MVGDRSGGESGPGAGGGTLVRMAEGRGELTVFDDDVFLASYPRSGNTWLRFGVSNLAGETPTTFDDFDERIPDVYRRSDDELSRRPRPRLLKTHERHDPAYPTVVYVVRDPRAVARSFHRYLRMRELIAGEVSLEAFLPGFVDGEVPFGSWHEHVDGWLRARSGDPHFLVVRYEDMLRDPRRCLRRAADLIGLPADAAAVDRAVELSSRERMRALEDEYRGRGEGRWLRGARREIPFVGAAREDDEGATAPMALVEERWGSLMRALGYL